MDEITLINPNLILQENDLFTTGIVYMPVGLAYFAGALEAQGYSVRVIDAFGENPNQWRREANFIFRGLTPDDVVQRLSRETRTVVLYAINLTYHRSLVDILKRVKVSRPDLPVIVMENTQAVTAYSLRQVQDELYTAGADYVLTGEAEQRGVELIRAVLAGDAAALKQLDGIGWRKDGQTHYTPPARKIEDLDALPLPSWALFPLTHYWALRYAHGPLHTGKYLPMLTSRGCPYPCKFCVIPETNDLKWRSRSAKHVVNEMQILSQQFQLREFHLEDVDPTINDGRIREICQEIESRGLDVVWKICAGTKVETIRSEETVELMARAGCRYISISPESGSPRVLKLINKPFDLDHAKKLIKKMDAVGIRSQACFVVGFPGEEDADRAMTLQMVKDLTRLGVDEIAVFIITPVPGSAIFPEFQGFEDYSQLTFSPAWRKDYRRLNRFRLKLYATFLGNKLLFHPFKFLVQPFHFLARRFETKMEMAPYRALHAFLLLKGFAGRQVTGIS
jgi:anaerobic magnesium-protoporphyrin IX monomethyl ester cyclase